MSPRQFHLASSEYGKHLFQAQNPGHRHVFALIRRCWCEAAGPLSLAIQDRRSASDRPQPSAPALPTLVEVYDSMCAYTGHDNTQKAENLAPVGNEPINELGECQVAQW